MWELASGFNSWISNKKLSIFNGMYKCTLK